MSVPLRVLIAEDTPDDAEMMLLELSRGDFDPVSTRVETTEQMQSALSEKWDIVLSDFSMPRFGALAALAVCRALDPDVPFIVVSGTIGEEQAVEMMRAGASDYLLKDNLTRLSMAVKRELRESANRQAKREAEQTVLQLAAIVQSSNDPIISKTLEGVITSWNMAAERLFGWSSAEAIGMNISVIVPTDCYGELQNVLNSIRRGKWTASFETKRLRKDRTLVDVSVSISPITDAAGNLIGTSSITRDITERKRLDREIQASEARFRRLFESDMLAMGVWNADGWIMDANNAMLHLLGFTKEEVKGSRVRWRDITPSEYADRDTEALSQIRARGTCAAYEKEFIHQSGRRIPILVAATAFEDGVRESGVFFAVDLTEGKKVEKGQALLAAVVGSSEDAILCTDLNGVVQTWNAAAERLFGYSATEAIGRADFFVPPELVDEVRDRDERLGRGEIIPQFEAVRLRKGGQPIPVSVKLSPVRVGNQVVAKSAIYRDITEQKLAEQNLRQSEQRYRTLVAATAAIVWDSPPSGDFDTEQPAWTKFTGQTLDQHRKWGWLNVVHADDREKSARAWETAVKQRSMYQVEHRLRRADGEYRHMSVRAIPILESGGTIREWVGIHTDVTEQKRIEEAVRSSEERFRAFMDNSPACADIKDLDGRFIYVNAAWLRQFEREPIGWQGKTNYDFWPRETADLFQGSDHECLARNTAMSFEETGLTALGEERCWMVMKFPLIDSGIRRIGGMAWNITDRKRVEEDLKSAQQRLRHVLASSPAVLFTGNVEQTNVLSINWISENVKDVLGYAPGDALEAGWWLGNIHAEEKEKATAKFREDQTSNTSSTNEYRFRHASGHYIWVRIDILLVRNENGLCIEAVGACSDITSRRRLEDQYRQAQKMDAFGQLAGGVAHDFNNLLTIINGYSDILLQKLSKGDPSRKLIGEIYKAGERSAGLTRQLLAFSRQQVLAPQILNLNEVVANTDKMLRRLIGEDIRLTTTLDSEPWAIEADSGQVEQVLLNLAVNARDAMPKGGRLIIETRNVELDETYVAANEVSSTGPYVLLSVADTGTGMTNDIMAKIFEPFFTTKEPGKGTGLGLATVYGIVRQSNGCIAVQSEVGVGTTFKIYLPRVEQGSKSSKSSSTVRTPPRGTETVLLTEDEAGVRSLASYVLEDCGYKVLEAVDGDDALKVAAKHKGPIHLLITDVVMPGTGGRSAAEELTKHRPNLQVLFMSGYTDDAVIRHGVLKDSVNFLQKPFSPIVLAFKVREVLDAYAKK